MLLCTVAAVSCSDTDADAVNPVNDIAYGATESVNINEMRKKFSQMPEEANDSLDAITDALDNAIGEGSDCQREYGYLGQKTVNKKSCYVFQVFYNYDGDYRSAGVFASQTADPEVVYIYNEDTKKYVIFDGKL